MRVLPWLLLGLAVGWLTPEPVRADPHSYAIVVGSNHGGHGQQPLQYALQDARRFAELLVELGRTPREQVQLVLEPSPMVIEHAIATLRTKLAAHAARGEGSKLIFYYSGHARARALSLGEQELPLDALRSALMALPSTLTVVVLDACQSGAFSGVKGAQPAADFSSSSVFDLRSEGVAVMASSTGAELSQESAELSSSYFTHHLVTGLRGAADQDHDGTVSLDEAYRYAYQNTLSDTLRTRVGSQHATLETELKGHGSVPLTYTTDADAVLRLPEAIEGRVVVQRGQRGMVLAELNKMRGAVLTLALPHGPYEVLVRRGLAADVQSCQVSLATRVPYTLDTSGCPAIKLPTNQGKGAGTALYQHELWLVELGVSFRFARDDAFVDTLEGKFKYEDQGSPVGEFKLGSFAPQVAVGVGLHRNVQLLARFDRLAARQFYRTFEDSDPPDTVDYHWRSWSVGLAARGRWPLLNERLAPFAELGLGLGIAKDSYEDAAGTLDRTMYGPVVLAALGLTAQLGGPVGLVLKVGYDYAPLLQNEYDQSHDDGGLSVGLGLHVRGLRGVF